MKNSNVLLSFLLTGVLLIGAATAQAQERLQFGKLISDETNYGSDDVYSFSVDEAGVLTIALYGDSDFALVITDIDGQYIGGGASGGEGDNDLNGDLGMEMCTVIITQEGDYQIQVRDQSDMDVASYDMSAGFVEFDAFEQPGDPDGRPSLATQMTLGEANDEDYIDTDQGDKFDWYVVTAETDGIIVAATRPVDGGEADLILEGYFEGDYVNYEAYSDQDLQGNYGNESVMMNVEAGQTVYFRVSGNGSTSGPYKMSSVFME